MDLSILDQLIPIIAMWTGLAPSTMLFYLGLVVMGSKLVSRLIPDDASGWRHIVKQVTRVIAVDLSNRVAPGVTQLDIARQTIGKAVEGEAKEQISEMAADAEALIPDVVGDNVRSIARDSLEAMRRRGEIDPNPDK